MSRNKIRKTNTLQKKRVIQFLAAGLLLTIFGLVYVFMQVRVHQLSEDIKSQEAKLKKAQELNSTLSARVESRKTPKSLQSQIAYLHLDLINISDPRIDVIEAPIFRRTSALPRGTALARQDGGYRQ